MRSFRACYDALPAEVRATADRAHQQLLEQNPQHPSLRFKALHGELWSARVGLNHRALATRVDGDFVWFWIGTHAEYDRLVSR